MSSYLDRMTKTLMAGKGKGGLHTSTFDQTDVYALETEIDPPVVVPPSLDIDRTTTALRMPRQRHSDDDIDGDVGQAVVQRSARLLSSPVIESAAELYAHARAQKEAALAAQQELVYKRKAGQYVPREDVRAATASAFAAIAQSMRSIPDLLERQIGLDPMVAERIGVIIDNHLNDLADELRQMHERATADEVSD